MKKTLIIGLLVVFVLISGCTSTTTVTPASTTPGPTTPAQTSTEQQVNIKDFNFVPATAEVPVGTTVTWINDDNVPHTVTSVSGSFDSGSIDAGKTYSYKFNQAGTFEYSCTIHPTMPRGKVIVR
ncbi:MAG: plastocyanin/azurin family copper binding protein [Candidatus Methanoperedens nitroreducens]|uniref:Plastocyanin/azurin family copper binding protein n=1 Tax=Candidatus Methanoperedens nitratireducens TaxID=1392998 RepID=A0A0P7ZIJ1_9EURY|nr:cupredoxin family copper-binding protein [Candidatus Methanoperedens sp. BLZ2]KAB2948478.1 MAG: amidase [Candidatus Methanoperedens sp.]KPQ43581.1 MAG: plastocyanin/azurin family copper binding protein [Candidatus Methanoperedens sp. BLZ1]MBZ0174421.1 cupredoxin family copper-binding protein [Candidatus Methanoperedens nitroreducens]CAG0998183.1 plastocyanin [Methanosarcinales archaeon]MCX9078441.1 cupredoxin family copper-binding protein [Candidatus Methanoperedens sp.]